MPAIISSEQLAEFQQDIIKIHANDEVKDYLQSLIQQTRDNSYLVDGLSPRAGLALFRIAQALAFIAGRDFLIPEDVQTAFIPTSLHRLRSRSSQQDVLTLLEKILNETRIAS